MFENILLSNLKHNKLLVNTIKTVKNREYNYRYN